MNAHQKAQTAYSSRQSAAVRPPRSVEYDVFARVTARLRAAHQEGRAGFAALAAALHDNRVLWNTLAADLAGDDNGLPINLRARLFYLAEFTTQQSKKILSGDESADVLIDINTAVMQGLAPTAEVHT